MARSFEDKPGDRHGSPVLVGIMGPSGGGKTFSALRLATGIQKVSGGEIFVIDTERKRALHYADLFRFRHIEFTPPFGSLDYLEAIQHCAAKGAGVIVIDSMSHEHEGIGGLHDVHDQELARLTGGDERKAKAFNMLAWQLPKRRRRQFINGLLQIDANFVFCFRAKNTSKPVKVIEDGREKTIVQPQGYMPVAGDELVFEMTVNCLLLPGANGVPTWQSEHPGERMMMKLPEQFRRLNTFPDGEVLSENTGQRLAEWAKGSAPATRQFPDQKSLASARNVAGQGSAAFKTWFKSAPSDVRESVRTIMDELKKTCSDADAASLGDTLQEGQGSQPAREDDPPHQDSPQEAPSQPAPAPAGASLADVDWYDRGRQDRVKGLMLRASPPEIRETPELIEAWRKGYMDEQNGVPRR